jgi:endonuclease/exonuclease/phosphatase family metal-dependent hydrolase
MEVMMSQPIELSVVTFNIHADFLSHKDILPWTDRKGLCVLALRQARPSLIGLQEVMPGQFDFLQEQLPEFTALSVTETTTDEALLQPIRQHYGLPLPARNEVVLFFRTEIFEMIDQGYWWLSPTPERISVGFGNIAPRLVLWARLRHKAAGQELIALTTHLDNRALPAMARLCQEKLPEFVQLGLPLIFMGDFNIDPARAEYSLLTGNGWQDSYTATLASSSESRDTHLPTFLDGRHIDHILYHGETLRPQAWHRLPSPDPEQRLSDHEPVLARFWLGF